ncbi:MAG: hypothetical protein O2870_02290 [Actinobacteria bacterium]|nr:hypothetical protein [Actinomycetota bacterium]
MTWYEVIITRGEPSEAVVIQGRPELLAAAAFLTEAAERGELGDLTAVRVYDEVHVPSTLLVGLLQHLGQPHEWVEANRRYPVYLSEV